MSKYIIEADERSELIQVISVMPNGTVYTNEKSIDELEELNSDYINEHYGDLQDTAYQRGLEDGKAVNEKGCEGCRFTVMGSDTTICAQCCNAYHNRWTAKDTYYDIIRNSIHNWVTELNVKLEDISKVLEDMKHD